MRFAVVRASDGFSFDENNAPPCVGARLEPRVNIKEEIAPHDGSEPSWWRESGYDFRTIVDERTGWRRYRKLVNSHRWVIEINTMGKLLEFADSYGGEIIVMNERECIDPMRLIVIYDDYVE